MSIKNCYYAPLSFLFIMVMASLLFFLLSGSNNAYAADSSTGMVSITFDTNPRVSPIVVDGVIYLPSQQPVSLSWKNDSSIHTFSIPGASVYEGTSKKYVFETWNDLNKENIRTIKASTENNNKQLITLFKTQYLLTILSDYSNPKGAGWYELGEIAVIEIERLVSLSNDTRAVFNGWSGGYLPNSAKNYVEISKPTIVVASWKEEYRLIIAGELDGNDDGPFNTTYIAGGSGWYAKGSTATIALPQEIELTNKGDERKKKFVFKQWLSIDSRAAAQISDVSSAATTVTMDRPYIIKAEWVEAYFVKIDSLYGSPSGGGYYKPNEIARISIEPIHEIEPSKSRMLFSKWLDEESDASPSSASSLASIEKGIVSGDNTFYLTVDKPRSLKAAWTKQFYIHVNSEYGIIEGSRWYDEGSNAVISLQQPTVDLGFGKSAKFGGWSPSLPHIPSTSSPLYVINNINGPHELSATWQVDETFRYVTIFAALGVTGVVILFITVANRKKKVSNIATKYFKDDNDVFEDSLWAVENISIQNTFRNEDRN